MQRARKEPPTPEPRPHDLLPEGEPMDVQDLGDSLVIRERDMFLLTGEDGQVTRGNRSGHGLYHRDTRYLCGYELQFSTARPLILLSTAELGYSSEQVMTNPAMVDTDGQRLQRGSVHVRRTRVIDGTLQEHVHIHNHNTFQVTIELQFRFAADFADIFEVRGWEAEKRGETQHPELQAGHVKFSSLGADGKLRQTYISFSEDPGSLVGDPDLVIATYTLPLKSQETCDIHLSIALDDATKPQSDPLPAVAGRYEEWLAGTTRVHSDNEFFNAIMERSLADIRMLWTEEDGIGFLAAGTPWYDALFGRDSCIAAMQFLAFRPDIAKQVLSLLASLQGNRMDPWRDEEPGKIPHELRRGELTLSGELPFSPYYGSIDSTPLFLILAGEYYRWTGDIAFIESIRPNVDAGLLWLREFGDRNGDGFIDYEKQSVKGLVNQGWKDSADAIVHRDGSLAPAPITLVEVQAYAYASLVRLAELYEAMSHTEAGAGLRRAAENLRQRLNHDFWMPDEACYALALDGEGHRVESVTSNAGHVLWAGAADPARAADVAARLARRDMSSGWGLRTLSQKSPSYNPEGYHLGTVWPHDNSLFALGLKRYGLCDALNVLATSLFEAAKAFQYYRLPELFGGSPRTSHQTPVPYPVACRPQAWAAGAIPMITSALLGLCPDAANSRLYIVRPALPDFLTTVSVAGLRVGKAEIDLTYERDGERTTVTFEVVRGDLEVLVVDGWPDDLR